MSQQTLVFVLAIVTLISALLFGLWQIGRVGKAKRTGETSAMTQETPRRRPAR